MKIFISITALVLVTGLFVYSCGGSEANTKTESTGTTEVGISGAQLYTDNCVICHGQDGKAGMSGATDLAASVLSHENTVALITNGRKRMLSFSNQFSQE